MQRRDLVFRVFVSSTFSDLKTERNALQVNTFPRLRQYCSERGARFQAIDLRWGVSDEVALDQRTMDICFSELELCQELSPKPNFITLLGQRYGWRPLPSRVPASEFERIEKYLSKNQAPIVALLKDWYKCDENAVPSEYVLLPRDPNGRYANHEEWQKVEMPMHKALHRGAVAIGLTGSDLLPYYASATHQEIKRGVMQANLPQDHVFAYIREIENPPQDRSTIDFIDEGDDQEALKGLIEELTQKNSDDSRHPLLEKNVYNYPAEWCGDHPESNLDALCEKVFQDLKKIIDRELEDFTQASDLKREQQTHHDFGKERCAHFKGRTDALERIKKYLGNSKDKKPLVIHGTSGCGKTALMARASLMASGKWPIDSDNPDETVSESPVIKRFIGATPGSADLRLLLRSLCAEFDVKEIPQDMNELIRIFRECMTGKSETRSGEYEACDAKPKIIFLDALDQLDNADNTLTLYWLPRELAPGVKLVLSVVESEQDDQNEPKGERDREPYAMCRQIWPNSLISISKMNRQDGQDLLDAWLASIGRHLQDRQKAEVLDKFDSNGLPLYLKLAFEEVCLWHSWDELPCRSSGGLGLGENVEEVLSDMLERLERPEAHGKLFINHALGSIASAKNGLTEDEMLDVLSRDVGVYSQFVLAAHHMPSDLAETIAFSLVNGDSEQIKSVSETQILQEFDRLRSNPEELEAFLSDLMTQADKLAQERIESPTAEYPEPIRLPRLPVVQWSRLHAALKPYIAKRRADGTNVMNFYHRQVAEAIKKRYLKEKEERADAHRRLSDYFAAQNFWAESLEAQRAQAKSLPPTPRPANIRKVVELPYHLLETAKLVDPESEDPDARYPSEEGAKVWNAIADLLTDWQFLEAKAEADPTGTYAAEKVNIVKAETD